MQPELDPAGVERSKLALAADADEGVGDPGVAQRLVDRAAELEVLPVQAVRRADRPAIRRHVPRHADLDGHQSLVAGDPPEGFVKQVLQSAEAGWTGPAQIDFGGLLPQLAAADRGGRH